MLKKTMNDIYEMIDKSNLRFGIALDKLDPDIKLTEQGLDSLDMASLLFEIEDYFNIEINDNDISDGKWNTLNSILFNINRK